MAIVEMKHLTLLAPKADRDRLLRALQKMNCVEISPPQEENAAYGETDSAGAQETGEEMKRIEWALSQLSKFDKSQKPLFGTFEEIPQERAAAVLADEKHYWHTVETMEGFERRRGELKGIEARAQAGIEQYEPWEGLGQAPDRALALGRQMIYLAGSIPGRNADKLREAFDALQIAAFDIVGSTRDSALIVAAIHRSVEKEARAALEQADFSQESFSALRDRPPAEYVQELKKRIAQANAERDQMQKDLAGFAGDIEGLKILYEILDQQKRRQEAAGRFAVTESTFLAEGWVPAESAEKVEKKIRKLSPVAAMELRDPLDEEQPPVQLHNNKFASAFEPVVEGYSLPDYRGIDPTAVMAPFYACLFGMMLSDAGYGLVMALLIPVFMKVKHIKFKDAKLLYLLTYGGIATIVWGLVYNTVFGFNPLPEKLWLLDAVNNSLPVMGVCIGVGALHLFAGLGVGAYMNFKRGKPLAALADQIAWCTLICGLGMLLLEQTKKIGQILAIASVVIILLFTKRGEKNPFKRILGGLSALYGISGWVSDLLSYMRLFGMGLATGVIGMVFNQLIGMIWGAGIIGKIIGAVLFVGCHAFNLGINALGAYVHSCRLQYIEFFGKFYEDGGRPFAPLGVKPKYVSIQPGEAEK